MTERNYKLVSPKSDRILSITGCRYHETRFVERWA